MKELLENHRRVWDRLHSEGYGPGYSKFNDERMDFVLSILPSGFLNHERIVLEIGCGGLGVWMKAVSPLVGQVHGVDFSPEAIKIAEKEMEEYDNVSLSVNDGSTLSRFRDKIFDLVYSFWTFQHCPREVTLSYLRESRRVLKKDGLMLFQVESYLDQNRNLGDINYLSGGTEQIGYTLNDILDAIQVSGLRIIRTAEEDFTTYKRVYLWSLCEKGELGGVEN